MSLELDTNQQTLRVQGAGACPIAMLFDQQISDPLMRVKDALSMLEVFAMVSQRLQSDLGTDL